jgi:hypothetical protein
MILTMMSMAIITSITRDDLRSYGLQAQCGLSLVETDGAEDDFQVGAVPLGGGNEQRRMIVSDIHARDCRTAMQSL